MSKFSYLAAPYIVRTDTKIGTVLRSFDIETDGLVAEATKLHCIVIADLDSDQIDQYGPDQIDAALAHLARADYLIGHNITGFDLPLLRRLYNWAPASGCTITDTLVASRLILPNVDDLDDQAAAMGDPGLGKMRGRYSLEAWGVRLGIPKIGADIEDWSMWTPEMQERCVGDVAICKALWRFLQPDGYSQQALDLEHRTAAICNRITADGTPFDVEAAERLRQQWTARRAELEAQLSQQFPDTNLNSRAQIGALLEARGWVPEKRTEKTKQPKIDDELLETIPTIYPEFAGLGEHYTLGRRLGQLADGDKAWIKHVGKDGCIHGGLIHIGTPHSRAKHLNPNLAQVPNPKKGKPLATECRELFHHSGDWVFTNCDQAGLQDRCFSHYLAAFDGGAYGRSFVAGVDTHWKSVNALGFISGERNKDSKLHSTLRESGAKPFRYGFLFGMRGKRAGEIIATAIRAARQVDPSYVGPSINGNQALQRFEAATPGLKQLRLNLEAQAARNGWVLGLDGRRVPTGAQYKALNRIVTSAEAIICKRWLINVYDELCKRFRYGWDGDVVITAWVHDELVICCRPEIAREAGEIMVRHARKAGEFYELEVPLDAEYNIGRSWAGDAGAENTEEFRGPTPPLQPDAASLPDEDDEKVNGMDNAAEGDSEDSDTATDERNPLDELLAAAYHAQSTSEEDEENIDDEDADSGGDSSSDAGANNSGSTFSGDPELGPYIYRDASGKPHAKIVRTPGRQSRFTQQHWTGTAWATGMPKHKLPYRLPELLAADPAAWVCITEGEKDCVNVAKLGFVATTNPNGAKGWNSAKLVPYFAHLKRIAILEDNDAAGRERSNRIITTLRLFDPPPDIRVVSFPELPEGGDVSDWLAQNRSRGWAELLARIEAAEGNLGILESIRADQVTMRAIHWLWGKRFAVGKIGIIAGLPDEGKGQILCYIAARATHGLEWPNSEGICPRGNVVILSAEENPGDSLAPRLKAAGADLSRIYFINMVQDRDEKTGQAQRRMFSLISDLEKLRRKILEVGNVVVILIDPISAYLGIGQVDSYRDTDVRAVMGPLKELAEELRAAVITVMHFNKKVDITNALLRVSNSMAFVGLPRHAYGVIADAENARKLFVRAKNNDAPESDNQTLAFHFDVKEVGVDPDTDEPIRAPFIVWELGYVDVTATEAMQAASEHKSPGERDKAKNLLLALLAGGREVFVDDIKDQAEGHGISWRTMRRAGDDLKVAVDKDRTTPKGKWFWKLPQQEGV